MKRAAVLLASAALLALARPAAAQVATNIVPDAGAGFATGTTISQAGKVTTIDGGARAGANLFHSFTTFDLASGETARWTASNPAGVANVVNRVTGGVFSTIAGTLDSTALPNANFYFINPAGVLFTTGAQLNVPNAAYVSTAAGGLTFADGAKFSAVTPNGSTFSMAAPQSFGFLGGEGNIIVSGAAFGFTQPSTSLSLTASNVGVVSSLFTPYRFDLVTTGSQAATIALADPLAGAPLAGQARLDQTRIITTATGKGFQSVRVGTGLFTQTGGALTTSTFFTGDAGDLILKAQFADVGGTLASNTSDTVVNGNGGTVSITVDSLHVGDGGLVSTSTFGAGSGGSIFISANDVLVDGKGIIASVSNGATATGKAGSTNINAATIVVQDGGTISASTNSLGDGGAVNLTAKGLVLVDDGLVSSSSDGKGRGGSVSISAASLRVTNGGLVTAPAFDAGAGGDIAIVADSVLLDADGTVSSNTSGGFATGRAGTVQIKANTLTVRDSGGVSSATSGAADAGAILITAGSMLVDDSNINAAALEGAGRGGLVSIEAGTLNIRNAAGVLTFTTTTGAAGTIRIKADKMSVSGGSTILATTSSAAANGGAGGDLSIIGSDLTLADSTIGSNTLGGGKAGNLSITVSNLAMSNASIVSNASSSGAAGDIALSGKTLKVTNDSVISSSTFGAGNGGQVSIAAESAVFDFSTIRSRAEAGSTGQAGNVLLSTPQLQVNNQTEIATATLGAGAAGKVSIVAKDMTVTGGSDIISSAVEGSTGRAGQVVIQSGTLGLDGAAIISSDTFARGDAGGVVVNAGKVTLANGSSIESGAGLGSSGNGGTVSITADSLAVNSTSVIVTTTRGPGNAGQLVISGGDVALDRAALGSTATIEATGAAGSIGIKATSLRLTGNAQIATSSRNPRPAGAITITSSGPVSLVGDRSQITSENLSVAGGAAGSITIGGAPILVAESGFISTNSTAGPAGDISLFVPRDSYLELLGRDAPGVITTSSGPGTGGRIIISEPLAVISNGGRILALGQAQGANVQLRSNFFIRSADRTNQLSVDGTLVVDSQVSDVSAGASIPDVSFLDASGVLRGQCPAARNGGVTSQLSLRAFGPYVAAPAPAAQSRAALAALSPDHCQ